jgi:hypothetical protein
MNSEGGGCWLRTEEMEYLDLAEGWEVVGSTSHGFLHYCRCLAKLAVLSR